MLKAAAPTFSDSVILPEVILVLVYAVLVRTWSIWTFCTLRYQEVGEHGPVNLVSGGQLTVVSLINVGLLALLGFALVRTKFSPPGLRRGHIAGIGLAAVVAILIQVAAFQGFGLEGMAGESFLDYR